MRRSSHKFCFLLAAALPFLTGVTCSSDAVLQSAATTFFNGLANNLISLLFSGLTGQ